MKISVALLVLLLAAAWAGSQGMSLRSPKVTCCSKEMFVHHKISPCKIQGYQHTPSNCTHKAVLVKLLKGMVCVDPEKAWFKDYLKKNSDST
ncbi:CCL13 protein, partial [Eulacestoma nigropectus]|nr:CCL13 protein [Eulacestoma nigropectus]